MPVYRLIRCLQSRIGRLTDGTKSITIPAALWQRLQVVLLAKRINETILGVLCARPLNNSNIIALIFEQIETSALQGCHERYDFFSKFGLERADIVF
jgi:hypothetical protein